MLKVKEIRTDRGLSQKELGKRIGVTEASISNYELGKREPTYEILLKMSEVLCCSVAALLGAEDYISKEEYEILDIYRRSTQPARAAIKAFMLALDGNQS